jgi:hypothetical protein
MKQQLTFYFETGSLYVAQAGFILKIRLPQLPQFWDCKYVPPCLAIYE